MPLIKSASKEAIGKNITTEQEHGKPHDQAVAIALNTARKSGANIPFKKKKKKHAISEGSEPIAEERHETKQKEKKEKHYKISMA